MAQYAKDTSVSVANSKAEIERILERYGAHGFGYGWEGTRNVVMFKAHGKAIRFELEMPDRNSDEFQLTPSKKWSRSAEEAAKAWEQACRQKWRALALVIKAKLEAVESGITTFETEFLAYIVLPNNQTVGQFVLPQVQTAYETGRMPALLPGIGETGE